MTKPEVQSDGVKEGKKYDCGELEPLKNDTKKEEVDLKNRTIKEQIKFAFTNITVEPVLAFYSIPNVISSLATQNLNLDKACRVNLNYGDEICDAMKIRNLTNYKQEEIAIQTLISSIQVWKSIIQTAIPIIIIILIGSWSDRTGKRKMCMIMPVMGEFMVCISNLMNAYFFYEIPVEVTMILEGVLPAISGGTMVMLLGIFSYISDISSTDNRTFRVGVVNLCMTTAIPIGNALSGIMVTRLGYYGVFSFCACCYLLTTLYIIYMLKEPHKVKVKTSNRGCFLTFFDLSNFKETLSIVFKKRENNCRMKIIVMLTIVAIVYGPNHGESAIVYLYTRYRFSWDAVNFSMYSTFSTVTHTCGALFMISVLSRRLKFQDAMLGFISVSSHFGGSAMKLVAATSSQMYMVPLVEILNATTFTSLRSIGSKLVPCEELGKINSMLSLVEIFAAMVYDPVYSWLYMLTLPTLPGAVFIFSAAMTIPSAVMFMWLFMQTKKSKRNNNIVTTKNEII